MPLWIAQGFGLGRIPFAPGTFGSLGGLLWFGVLLYPGRWELFLPGCLLGLAVSVWSCGVAEKVLGRTDPGCVVMDEIAAMPCCFAVWCATAASGGRPWPGVDLFLSSAGLPWTVAVFCLFRLFDIWKPWPVKQSQELPGGWGVTVDDLLAAGYVNLVIAAAAGAGWLPRQLP
jgi:phosphatidylglycerophosphatase A